METYGLKYIASFQSEVVGHNYEIRILERNYVGESMHRNLGGAPELIKDNNDPICGTSLEFLLETVSDGDLREFYTEDNKKFKVEVWRNEELFWVGFVVTEVYSESMVPIADISIRATDGLGLLKIEEYNKSGECTLLDIIKYCTDKSGLSLGFDFRANMGIRIHSNSGSYLDFITDTVNAEVLVGYKNCYDALATLLETFALSITQSGCRWVVSQRTIARECVKYNENAQADGKLEKSIIKIGRMDQGEADAFPVGSLEMEIEPSRKSVTVTEKQLTYPSLLDNWDFSGNRHWDGKGRYMTIGEENCYYLPNIYKDFDAFNTISQTQLGVNQTSNALYLELKYAVFTNRSDLEHFVWVHLIIESLEGVRYWLSRNGWKTGPVSDEEMLVFTVSELTTHFADTKWNDLKIYIDGFPFYGTVKFQIYNVKSSIESSSDNVGLYLSEVRLMHEIPGAVEKTVPLSSTASEEESFALVFGDSNYVGGVKASAMGRTGYDAMWEFPSADNRMTFIDLMCQVWANIYNKARRKLSGTILFVSKNNKDFESDFLYLYDNRSYKCLSGNYNLLADEMDVELIEIDDFIQVIAEDPLKAVRSVNIADSVYRASSEKEYRTYSVQGASGMQPKMIRELEKVEELTANYLFEVDNGFSGSSERLELKMFLEYLSKKYWDKEELKYLEGYLYCLGEKIKSGYADNSGKWDGNIFSDFINQPVRTIDEVKFKSIQTTNYLPGLTGTGARINEQGYAEMTGLTLREFLEVPELRFNRVDVVSGELWNAAGYGLIENVDVVNCIATLKLEEGELAGIEVNDICRGIFHNLTGNADGSVKDGCGFSTMPGFSTSYFTPVELLEGGKSFRYELKPGTVVHPTPAMKFAVYGNFTNKSRQASAYSTRTYKRYLKDVNTWEIDPQRNIAMQFGDLSGLYINGMSMEGYSAYLNNIYFSGYMQFTPGQLEEIKGKDGYSVNLTSYDAVVAVDSEGRIDSSVYDIINVVNGNELVQTGGSQVVTTRYKIQTEIEAYQGKTRLVYDETPGVGQYTAVLRAKGCEYAFSGGVLTITKITEDKASVEIEVNCEGAAVFTMTFTLTRVYGGVNADWPSYVFKQSVEKPEPPTGTDPRPVGWEDAPSSEGKWWMSKATISGVTGLAGPWSDPVQVTAEDGVDGGYTDFKFAKNNSETIAPALTNDVRYPEGWTDDPPEKISGEYIWMTKAPIDANGQLQGVWSPPVRISGEKGNPADWTSYIFKQSEEKPEPPEGTAVIPTGWDDGPGGTGRWWMSKATISGLTGLAGSWSDPVQVTGVDGNNGKDGEYVIYEYSVNYSETVAPGSGWSRTVPNKGPGQYLWMRWGTVVPPATNPVTWDGVARVTGEKGEKGDPGMPGKYTKLAYQYGFSQPSAPSGFSPQGWMNTPDKEKLTFAHGSTFTLKEGWYVSPKISGNGFTTNRISFTTRQNNQMVFINLRVSSEKYDYAYVGTLDKNLAKDVNYIDRFGGEVDKIVRVVVPSAGSHFIDIGYGKDSSIDIGEDCCRYRMTDCGQCWLSTCECVWMDSGYAAGAWTTPVPFITDTPDKEEIYLLSDSAQKPSTPESAAYMDDFVPALTKREYKSDVANATGDIVRSGDEFYVCLKANTGQALTNSEYWKRVPGWTDNPTGVSDIYPYEYISTRKKADGKWGPFSAPTIWGKFGQDGKDAISVYKASVSQPDTPSGTTVPPSGWSLTPPVRQTGEFIWVSSPVYDSDNNITGWSVPTKFSGDTGSAGPQGMICRVSEWSAGVYYRNDRDTVTDGLRYLDVVVVTNKDTGNFLCYEARAAHNGVVSSEENKPGNDTFWLRFSHNPPIYTPLILAENGVIRFAQSNQLLIQQDDGTIDAGASGKGKGAEGVRFWAGSENPLVAPWRVYANGKFVSGDADITGRIIATQGGQVGPFKISSGSLEAISDGDKMSLSSSLITFKNDTNESYAYIGSDTHSSVSGGALVGPVRLEVSRTSTLGIYGNAALDISVSGCNSSDNVGQQFTGNHALYIRKGNICGFRLRSRRVNSNETLSLMDSIIHCINNSGDITLTLPSGAEDGQIYFIRKCAAGNININGRIKNDWGGTTTSVYLDHSKLGIFIYDKVNNQWTSNRADGF